MKRLEGRTALVTGAGQGIGRAIAIRLAQEGAHIVVNDVRETDNSKETMRQLEEMGCKSLFIATDVSKVDQVRAMFEKAIEQMGGLDILVNNAGIEINAPFWEVTEEHYDAVMDVNLKGTFFCTQAFAQHIMAAKRKKGVVVNNSSVHEELPMPNFTAYCASKGAIQMVMRNLSVELAPYNIRINNVAPGAIKTPINAQLLTKPELLCELKKNISLNRLGEPEDVAAVVAFLASDDSKYVTGSTYYVDGGLTWNYSEQ